MAIKSKSLLSSISFVAVCFVFVLLSLWVERALHHLGKFLKHKNQDILFEALQKLKEELMILGFISLRLSVFQTIISRICIQTHLAQQMTPCKSHEASEAGALVTMASRRLLSSEAAASSHCPKGKVPIMSVEALHQLHIFIFVLAIVHVIFCDATMFLGGARVGSRTYSTILERSCKGRNIRRKRLNNTQADQTINRKLTDQSMRASNSQ